MQVLENAVRKLKMPAHAQEAAPRVEPRFTTVAETSPAGSAPRPEPRFTEPAASAVPPPPPRAPLFADLPEPEVRDDAPASKPVPVANTGGGGGGGSSSSKSDDGESAAFGPILTWLGAAAAVALVLGVSVWTYRLGQRDAMEVPIVAALEGPARVLPDDAGGRVVAHQGHSVNEVLEGQGVADVASSVTTIPSDNDLTAEDAPQRELTALIASQTPMARPATETQDGIAPGQEDQAVLSLRLNETEPVSETATTPIVEGASTVTAPVSTTPEPEALAEAKPAEATSAEDNAATTPSIVVVNNDAVLPAPEKPVDGTALDPNASLAKVELQTETPVTVPTLDTTAATEAQPADVELAALGPFPPVGQGSAYAPAVMETPRARPADLNVAMANAVNAALEAVLAEASVPAASAESPTAGETTVAAATPTPNLNEIPLPAGTRMIQIGAYGSEAVARQQWDRLSSQHSDLLGSKEHYVQRTDNSGKIFYRLRVAGYETKDDTRSACAALSARGLPCITVTLR